MIYERCKCGDSESWSSGTVQPRCLPCTKCNTIPASHPDFHPEPVPHDFKRADDCPCLEDPAISEEMRERHHPSRCRLCHYTKAQIAGKK